MIEGVRLVPLSIMPNDDGDVLHMLRSDSEHFSGFGEVYFSYVNPGCVKGWKKHLRQTQHFAVPSGNIKLVIYDDREGSATKGESQEINIGEDNYQLVRIPNGVWYSFGAADGKKAMIVNCTDIPHDPQESVGKPLTDPAIPYVWEGERV